MLSHFSHVQLCVTLWTIAHQAPLCMGFFRQEHWIGLPGPLPGDLHHPGIEPVSLMSPALAGGFFTTSASWGFPGGEGTKKQVLRYLSTLQKQGTEHAPCKNTTYGLGQTPKPPLQVNFWTHPYPHPI